MTKVMNPATTVVDEHVRAALADIAHIAGKTPTYEYVGATFHVAVPWPDGRILHGSVDGLTALTALAEIDELLAGLIAIAADHAQDAA